ncbi:hypothetical protein [Larkinella humicola]|uniref:Toprim domain-containing protein n=1 Tax=Larkinella humicola TaxID=2607654 RepID=A0A5N1J1S4_9BACT|nr:hypothetical protein [Larkinella humicola]KAA9340348.1 hypothetical protein F0P93_31340 [Larkinella humicola]
MNIKQAIDTVSLKDLVESTGRQPTSANIAKGEYTYQAPYRDDIDPSFKINIYQKKFIDYGQEDAKGDVVHLARLIMGNGNASAITVSQALQWLKQFSGGGVAATPAQPTQKPEKPVSVASYGGDRYQFVKAVPVSSKSHPNNLDYITKIRKIDLSIASRFLDVITYKDNAAPKNDPLKGYRYGIGGQNDAGGYEVRAASVNSNFKTSLGQKDITTFNGSLKATSGDIFEGRFDFLTFLQMKGITQLENPAIILNTGRFAARAAEVIKSRPEWQHVKHWRIWQHNDEEGERTTQVLCTELGDDYSVGTLNHYYEGYNDLNQWWTDAPDTRSIFAGRPVQKSYDGSYDAQRANTSKPK